jgi:hypothetical protein
MLRQSALFGAQNRGRDGSLPVPSEGVRPKVTYGREPAGRSLHYSCAAASRITARNQTRFARQAFFENLLKPVSLMRAS